MINETPRDRIHEREIARFVRDTWFPGVMLYATDTTEVFDFRGYGQDNKLAFIMECKDRLRRSTEFEALILDKRKVLEGYYWARLRHTDYVIAIRWLDCIGMLNVNWPMVETWEVKQAGRIDRGDPLDIDECYMIPVSSFDRRTYAF